MQSLPPSDTEALCQPPPPPDQGGPACHEGGKYRGGGGYLGLGRVEIDQKPSDVHSQALCFLPLGTLQATPRSPPTCGSCDPAATADLGPRFLSHLVLHSVVQFWVSYHAPLCPRPRFLTPIPTPLGSYVPLSGCNPVALGGGSVKQGKSTKGSASTFISLTLIRSSSPHPFLSPEWWKCHVCTLAN